MISGLLDAGAVAERVTSAGARAAVARTMTSTFLAQLLDAAGAFDLGDGPGAGVLGDLVTEVMADTLSGAIDPFAARPAPRSRAPTAAGAKAVVDHHAARMSSGYGVRRDPFHHQARMHRGVDIAAPEGSSVRSPREGRVVFAGERGGYGNLVEIEGDDGVVLRFAHLSSIAVREGDRVGGGAPIGAVGKSGRATGSHLHLEAIVGGRTMDPIAVLKKYGGRADSHAAGVSRRETDRGKEGAR